ncbi:GTP-binding protein [Stella humosa]|uniref:GTPase Der n=1 Tax=Stella humosa TaxID=94 RepID=A0A3N1MDV5_9PROT|nr:ribosome biogenesis GTPase Der [Stella humosa]ROQ01305.1 GTP-binding protein [Stella humosa]BBK31679.1 GTPase Der [Stella humosa]
MSARVAIVGRPNVGKSTLFNRLAGRRLAIVDDLPGVTRDRRETDGKLGPLRFTVIDTAGLEDLRDESLESRMRVQTEQAVDDADAVLMVIDGRVGVTPMDRHFADWLRRQTRPVVLVVNKCEGRAGASAAGEAYALGLGDPVAVSAEHGEGMLELYEALAPLLGEGALAPDEEEPALEGDDRPDQPISMAFIGRPNVGKSTLANRLIGSDRMLTGPEAGITRDAISVDWEYRGRRLKLVDTAGLRRRANVFEKLEKLATDDTDRAMRFAQVVVLVLDATQLFEKQDLTIARRVIDEGRALVIAISKWDLVEDRQAALQGFRDRLETSLQQVKGILMVPVSGETGDGVPRLMDAVFRTFEAWNRRVPTHSLNRWLKAMSERHPPPMVQGRRLRLRYLTQTKVRPPTFQLFLSRPDSLPDDYSRYIVNGLREDFAIPSVPIRLILRKADNPFADKGKKDD